MKKEEGKRVVSLPTELYGKVKERVRDTEFASVDEYVTFVLEEVLKEEEKVLSDEEEEEVKKRLKALGYLD